ncbi:MAG TPA: molecular chaperone HscC, partial [Pseudomonas sp.]|nr:molecular chaperone HscC [Pseudomonas sp.]
ESGHYLPLIERNSSVPVSRVKTVVTLHDNQSQVLLKIFQGESRLVKDNIELGQLDIAVPKRKAGEVSLDVRFTYDNNGLLEAQVKIPLTGEQHSLVIENNPGVLSPEEIQQRLQALAQLKVHPRDQQVNTVLVARLERLYQESLGEVREQLGHWAAQFQQVLDTQDERRIREARSELTRQLEHLDNGFWR